jgi:hypothetical protein
MLAFRFGGCGPHLVATNFIHRILDEALDMETIEDDLRLRGDLGGRLDVRAGHVDRHRLHQLATRAAQAADVVAQDEFMPATSR